jgi:putative ABC transport system permease protein
MPGGGGGVPARRAVVRWAVRLLRREWRQQLLILALITVAVGATVVASTVATDSQGQLSGVFGTAQAGALISGPPATVNAGIRKIERLYGTVDVIENESVQIPGRVSTFDLRAQDPHGPFGGPVIGLVSGQYPAAANQVAVTSGVAADFKLSIGSGWTVAGKTRKVTGIVRDPENLAGQFALVILGQVTDPSSATVLFDAPGATAGSIQSRTGLTVYTPQTVANTNEINPETISVTAAVLGLLLIALVGTGGFTVLAQRRLRAIGMLAAQGATQRDIGLVVRANGAATGVAGAIAGLAVGFLAWLAYRPHAEISADHVMGTFDMPWTVIVISMVLAVIATYFAASRPAKAIARTPIVAALAGRPAAPKKTRHLSVPIGIGCLAVAFLLLGAAGATGGDRSRLMGALVLGFVALAVAVVLLAPALLGVVAVAGRRSPIPVRLALRDLARYRARSGPALAAISLSTLIAVIICVISAARFGEVLEYTGPNLTSSQLIVYAPGGQAGSPESVTQARKVANEIAADLSTTSMITLQTTSAGLVHAAPGPFWSGQIYVATPQLLRAFGISSSQVNPDADILTMRSGLSRTNLMQLLAGGSKVPESSSWPCPPGNCITSPLIQEVSQLPSGTSAPNTLITEHAITVLDLQSSITTVGWLIQAPASLTAVQVTNAQQLAAGASGVSVETRDNIPSLAQIIDAATIFGIVLALGIVALSVGLVRSEGARDLRILAATGASGSTRRTITAATAAALAFTGGVLGVMGGYVAAVGFFRSNSLYGLSLLTNVPVTSLLVILVGMPLAAAVLGWLLAGRDPAGIARQPLE